MIRVAVENHEAATPIEKFGCSLKEAKDLLNQAYAMQLTVVGVRYKATICLHNVD